MQKNIKAGDFQDLNAENFFRSMKDNFIKRLSEIIKNIDTAYLSKVSSNLNSDECWYIKIRNVNEYIKVTLFRAALNSVKIFYTKRLEKINSGLFKFYSLLSNDDITPANIIDIKLEHKRLFEFWEKIFDDWENIHKKSSEQFLEFLFTNIIKCYICNGINENNSPVATAWANTFLNFIKDSVKELITVQEDFSSAIYSMAEAFEKWLSTVDKRRIRKTNQENLSIENYKIFPRLL